MTRDQPPIRVPALILGLLGALLALGATAPAAMARTGPHHGNAVRRAHHHVAGRSSVRPATGLSEEVASRYRGLTGEVLEGYADGPEHHYGSGLWENGDESCWYCNVGPATGAAYLSDGSPSMYSMAVDSFNRLIAEHRQPNGSFLPSTSPAIASSAFAVLLGMADVKLESRLDAATKALWRESLSGIADYLIADRDATWYANGNINASYAAAFYFAWRATGAQKYQDAFNAELEFMQSPTGHLWEGFGLVITSAPTLADGSDGRGFLTEGSPPAWDPEYSHLQLDFLSALYSASSDPRVLRLLNLILNQELTRVDPATFLLDARGGSRKNEMMAFTSAALPLLVLDGDRPDLAPLLPAAFTRLSVEYGQSFIHTNHNFYRGVGLWLAPVLLATSGVPSIAVPPSIPKTPSASGTTRAAPGSPTPPVRPARSRRTGARTPQIPAISPHVLGAGALRGVTELEIPGVEYAFAVPSAMTHGVVAPRLKASRLVFAAFACIARCKLGIRPELVIHASGDLSPVVVQTSLTAQRATLAAGAPFVSRVLVPRIAVKAARAGKAVFVRLRLLVTEAGGPPHGRSYMFKVTSH